MSYLVIILIFIFLVVAHELGHFFAARAVGIRVTKFYLFFPPALFRHRRGDVEYGIGAIPLGGFVKMPGMFEPVPEEIADRLTYELERATADAEAFQWKVECRQLIERVRSAETGELSDRLGDLADFLEQEYAGGNVSAPSVTRLQLRVSDSLDDLHEQAYWRTPLWKRMVTIFAGPAVNIALAIAVAAIFFAWFVPNHEIDWRIATVVKNSPAAEAGLHKNDRILRVNGQEFSQDMSKVIAMIDDTRGKPVTLTVRGSGDVAVGTERTVRLVPRKIEGKKLVGIVYEPFEGRRVSTGMGIVDGVQHSVHISKAATVSIVSHLSRLYKKEQRDQLGTVVGVVKVAPQTTETWVEILERIVIISLSLGVFNLLPILPLDGGHLTFGFIEFLRRGRPLPRDIFERASMAGLVAMLMLFMVGLKNDLTLL